MIIVMVVTT